VGSFPSRLHRWLPILAIGLVLVAGGDSHAQTRLDARYTATLAGIPIGKGTWVIDVGDDQYRAAATGSTAGLLQIFASGRGTGASQGTVVNGQLVPASYAASVTSDKKTEEVRIALVGGNVKDYAVEPPSPPEPDRIPITEAHRRGVIDPMTGSIMRVGGSGDPLAADSCQRSLAIFDGRMRYNLQLAFKRMEQVKAEKGYEGPALVCSVYFAPVAGHIPDRAAIKYLVKLRDMEVWLVPVGNTRVLAPYRFSVPTPIGLGVLQATQFVSASASGRPAAASAKTQ
jgi:hypothetical protein